MPQENSQHGGEKFINRFTKRLEDWKKENEELNKEDYKRDRVETVSEGELKKEDDVKGDRVKTDSQLPKYKILGFENEIKSLHNFLLDQKVYMEFKSLVIVGEYGVGKTALCKKIFNDKDVQTVYSPMIWVSINESNGKTVSVVKNILMDLGVEESTFDSIKEDAVEEKKNKHEAGEDDDGETLEEKELSALLYALHLNLRWKKYLIVFDDVREEDNWNEKLDVEVKEGQKWGKCLSDGFPKGSGGRVIYTTRDEEETLAKKLVSEEHMIHRLWPLSDHQSVWEIYKAAFLDKQKDDPPRNDKKIEDPPRNDKKCIDELMNKSRGLPLAARLLAVLDPVYLDDETEAKTPGTANPAEPANGTSPSEV